MKSATTQVSVSNFGGILVQLIFKGRDLVLGYDSIQKYIDSDERYFGAIVGPVCNRIMPLDVIVGGKPVKFESDKEFLLHSNALLSYRVWDVVSHGDAELVL